MTETGNLLIGWKKSNNLHLKNNIRTLFFMFLATDSSQLKDNGKLLYWALSRQKFNKTDH